MQIADTPICIISNAMGTLAILFIPRKSKKYPCSKNTVNTPELNKLIKRILPILSFMKTMKMEQASQITNGLQYAVAPPQTVEEHPCSTIISIQIIATHMAYTITALNRLIFSSIPNRLIAAPIIYNF